MRVLNGLTAVALLCSVACGSNPPRAIGGTVSGLAGTGLTLQDNGGDDLAISADGPFVFAKKVADATPYSVTVSQQPTGPSQVCTVTQAGTKATADVKDVAVTCTTSAFTVSGTVAGLSGSGLVLQDNAGDDLKVMANGTFSFAAPVASGHAYAVTVKTQPSNPTETCTVSGGAGTVGAGPVSSILVNCSVNTYTIGGTVTGLAGAGLTLKDNGGDDLPISGNGTFAFQKVVASGQTYAVTIGTQPSQPTQTCSVAGGSGTVVAGNITSVAITCSTNVYKVSGAVSGLVGSGLVLSNANGDSVSVAQNGPFVFGTLVASGQPYAVTVQTQPTSPSQTCVVASGAGNVVDGDITAVAVTCTTNTYKVTGTVSGLAGTGLKLQDNGSDDLAVTANGTFTFPTQVASGAPYAVTIKTQPTAPSQTCSVAGGAGTVGGSDVASITVNCSTNHYAVGGTVSGLAGNGLTLTLGSGAPLSISGNGSFAFPTPQLSGTSYAVTVATQPTQPWQTCTVANGTGTVGGADVTNVAVTCVKNTYAVTGTVSGLSGAGLTLQDNGGDNLAVSANGTFQFPVKIVSGQPYAVTVLTQPSQPTQTCTVTNGAGSMAGADVTNVAVACVTNTYKISGTVTGLAGTVVLQDNAGDNLTVTTNGSFTFPTKIASKAPYSVTVLTQPATPSQTCTVSSGSGTVVSADITNVAVTCVTNKFNLKVAVTGLSGAGLVLQNNGGDNLSVPSAGTFTFPTQVTSGTAYNVSTFQQPQSPWQTCTAASGSGIAGGADITVAVSCTTNSYAVGGAVSGLTGTGLTVALNGGTPVTVSSNGPFSFPGQPSGSAYAVTVVGQPTSPWQTCSVANGTGTVAGADVTNVAITCVTNTYLVSGTVTGLAGTGLTLQDNGGDTLGVSTSGGFKFANKVASGQPYAVTVATQPSSPSQTCTVTNGAGVMAGADISNVTVACVTNTYRIGGTVSGLAGTVALQDNGGDTLSVSANGAFVFATRVASGATYVVTAPSQPTSPSQTCTVTNASGTVVSSDVSNVAVTCVTNKFNVKVAITGLAGSGLVLQDNGGDNLTANTNSTYTFATKVASGSPYSVSVLTQPSSPWQTCAVSSPSGVVGGADVLVNATCTTNSYTVGGAVSGLPSSAAVVLQDNGANDLSVTGSGSFTFPAVASGQPYAVTVKTQPTGYYCTLANASGTVTNAAITNVAVSCTISGCGRFNGTFGSSWQTVASVPNQGYEPGFTDYPPTSGTNFYSLGGSAFAKYDSPSNSWITEASAPVNVSHWATPAWVGNFLYVMGGNVLQAYNVSANSWSTLLSNVPNASYTQNAHDDAGNVYAWGSDATILKYNIASNTLTHLTTGISSSALSEPRLTWDSCTRKLYMAPSFYNNGAGANFYSFDPATQTTVQLPMNPGGMMNDATCSDRGGHIYAAGAASGTTFFQFNTATNTWASLPATPFDHGNNGACGVTDDGYLYITPATGSAMARLKLN